MNKRYKDYLFYVAVLIIIYSIVSVGKYLHYPPAGIHHWAQSDRASIAYIYYLYNNSFFLPMTFNFNNGNGITGVEFPIIYYSVAQLYKIFGFSDFIFRIFTLSTTIIAFFYFVELLKLFNKNFWIILLGIILLYTSPIFVYYSFSYIPDIVSINLFIISLYYIEKYRRSELVKYLLIYFILISLVILIKITFAIYLLAILSAFILIKKNRFITKQKIYITLISIISLLICFAWYFYSRSINEKYNAGVFLMDLKPSENIIHYINNMLKGFKTWFTDFINPASFLVISTIIVYLSNKLLQINRFYLLSLFISIIGVIVFTYLFSHQYIDHDYYYVQFYSLLIIVYIIFIDYLNVHNIIINTYLTSIVISLSLISLTFLKLNINDRFDKNSKYNNYSSYHNTINLININREIESLNIPITAKFIVFDDPSMNISLYYLKRFGVQLSYINDQGTVDWYMSKNEFEYVLINNNNFVNNSMVSNRLGELVLSKENYSIYKKIK